MTEKPLLDRIEDAVTDSHADIERLIDDCKEEIERLHKISGALDLICEAIVKLMNRKVTK